MSALTIGKKLGGKLSSGHNFLKNNPNWAYEFFFYIYGKCKCQKTPYMPDLDHFLRKLWPFKSQEQRKISAGC